MKINDLKHACLYIHVQSIDLSHEMHYYWQEHFELVFLEREIRQIKLLIKAGEFLVLYFQETELNNLSFLFKRLDPR